MCSPEQRQDHSGHVGRQGARGGGDAEDPGAMGAVAWTLVPVPQDLQEEHSLGAQIGGCRHRRGGWEFDPMSTRVQGPDGDLGEGQGAPGGPGQRSLSRGVAQTQARSLWGWMTGARGAAGDETGVTGTRQDRGHVSGQVQGYGGQPGAPGQELEGDGVKRRDGVG